MAILQDSRSVGRAVKAILVVLAASPILGFALGLHFSWVVIVVSGLVFAIVSAAILETQEVELFSRIAIIVACFAVNQIACLIGVAARPPGHQ
jgi:hypothetical protein